MTRAFPDDRIAITLAALAAALLAPGAPAQDDTVRQPGTRAPERHVQEPARDAAAKPAVRIVAHRVLIGAPVTNGMDGDAEATLGRIGDLVVDAPSGTVRYAALESNGPLGGGRRTVRVPWERLAWDAEAARFTLPMSPEALAELPAFDPNQLDDLGGAGTAGVGAAGDGTAGTADASATGSPRRTGASGTNRAAARTERVLASAIPDWSVLAREEALGSADTLFVEPASGTAAFVTVSSGGLIGIGATEYVIPWSVLELVEPDDDGAMRARIAKDKASLATAPKLGDDGADLNAAEFRRKVYAFHGATPPAFEPAAKHSQGHRESPRRDRVRDP